MKNSTLQSLKAIPGIITCDAVNSSLAFSLLPGGIPEGRLTEMSGDLGSGKTEAVLQLLKENPSLTVAWIEKELTLYPRAFLTHDSRLERVLFIESGKTDPLWVVNQLLRSQLFDLIVCSEITWSEADLRRLQIAARKSGPAVVLLQDLPTRKGNWPLSLQICVSRCPFRGFPILSAWR